LTSKNGTNFIATFIFNYLDKNMMDKQKMLPLRFWLILIVLASLSLFPADQVAASQESSKGLGKIIFINSCTPESQPPLLKGIAQLHSFQYAAAETAFTEVIHADPKCAIAYWGLAMSSYRPLWDGADEKALKKGRHFLDQIQKDWPVSQREREYIDAIALIFSDNRDLGNARIAAYSRAMAEIAKHYPDDGEAQAFYALSLLALPHDDTKTREQVIAILNKLMAAQPEHPGAVHYLIHAADTSELAPQGLEAARRYAKIAPDSSHALHMPSHIFVRLGLWQESVDSNLAAAASAAEATQHHMGEPQYQFHAMDFLDFSYLQLGEEAKARQVIEDLNNVPGGSGEWIKNLRVILTTRNLLELHRWKDALALTPQGDAFELQLVYALRSIAAARTGDPRAAEENYKNLKRAMKQKRGRDTRLDDYRRQEVEAWVAFAAGDNKKAIKRMRAAANKQDAEDSGDFTVPAREMVGDLLMELHHPAQALAEYESVLKMSPNRFNDLYGAAVAAQMAGDSIKAKSYYSKLRENCPPTADRAELQKMKLATAGTDRRSI
jgi:tetratricopeptide (TPR) repeat protein